MFYLPGAAMGEEPVTDQTMQHGYLVLADISGYTAYLAGVELDHAHEILSDLLETIVEVYRALEEPPFNGVGAQRFE